MVLPRKFYERYTLLVAKELLGKIFVHKTKEGTTVGKIVETEAYIGPDDRASHAYKNKYSKRTRAQFGPRGHAYIYQIYGMYFCFNIVTGRTDRPEVVLIRALEPIDGIELMAKRRGIPENKIKQLMNGPGKLCKAMDISTKLYGIDLCNSNLFIENGVRIPQNQICHSPRINIDYAGESKYLPWRFYIRNNEFVSVEK